MFKNAHGPQSVLVALARIKFHPNGGSRFTKKQAWHLMHKAIFLLRDATIESFKYDSLMVCIREFLKIASKGKFGEANLPASVLEQVNIALDFLDLMWARDKRALGYQLLDDSEDKHVTDPILVANPSLAPEKGQEEL